MDAQAVLGPAAHGGAGTAEAVDQRHLDRPLQGAL
jgi:hypothetical protein